METEEIDFRAHLGIGGQDLRLFDELKTSEAPVFVASEGFPIASHPGRVRLEDPTEEGSDGMLGIYSLPILSDFSASTGG